jgi:hypothetical protein
MLMNKTPIERAMLKLKCGTSKIGTAAKAINPRLKRTITNKWSQRSKKVFFIRKPIMVNGIIGHYFLLVYGGFAIY